MTKKNFKEILDKFKSEEDEVSKLDNEYGICVWNSSKENFYNKLHWIIDQLFTACFGEKQRDLIYDYLFEENVDFDDLCEFCNINE